MSGIAWVGEFHVSHLSNEAQDFWVIGRTRDTVNCDADYQWSGESSRRAGLRGRLPSRGPQGQTRIRSFSPLNRLNDSAELSLLVGALRLCENPMKQWK
jgi:hypothetical protein